MKVLSRELSGNDIVYHVSGYVRQAEISSTITVGKLGVIDTHQVENGGVQVVHMHPLIDALPPEIIGGAIGHPALHAAAGQPDCEAVRIVIAPVMHLAAHEAAAHFYHRRSAELGATHDQSLV